MRRWGNGAEVEHFFWWLECGANCTLAFSIFRDTSGVTNRINKRLITLKGNSSGFNRILITAYRYLLVTLNYHSFPLFTSLFFLFSGVCIDKTVSVLRGWITAFISNTLIIFYIHLFFTPSKPCFMMDWWDCECIFHALLYIKAFPKYRRSLLWMNALWMIIFKISFFLRKSTVFPHWSVGALYLRVLRDECNDF